MEAHEHVVKKLNEEFKKVDRCFSNNEMRVFGKSTNYLFENLNRIREKQIEIANDHILIHDIPIETNTTTNKQQTDFVSATTTTFTTNTTTATCNNNNITNFNKMEDMLKKLMIKLDDLTESMDQFKKLSELKNNDHMILHEEDIHK
ncbi:uncharacterized protein BX663DRAFT_243891 [Cokeromyces recurvatus]|uniref:uncharacterized protein n=1 Tax=Cokeromyces recurvatus TaxID=90255 RepID=UPI00221F6C2A|nr:uncharacterized protein BX663DRAFT_243891 [Cokeromyces recurvatus]KAI7905872.1 hypothetical protein BX663DRAFT_243891 [Cokeromyces recurvatus]